MAHLLTTITMIVLSLEFTSGSDLKGRSVKDIPSPITNPFECGRPGSSYICNPDQVLTSAQADKLEMRLIEIRNTTLCPCSLDNPCKSSKHGYVIGVAIIKKIQLETSGPLMSDQAVDDDYKHAMLLDSRLRAARQMSHDLLVNWNIGHCHDSVLVLYSASDNLLYTAVDRTARQFLTDDLVGEISSNVRMDLSKNITQGLDKLLQSYESVFLNTYIRTTYWDDVIDALPVIGAAASISMAAVSLVTISALLSFLLTGASSAYFS